MDLGTLKGELVGSPFFKNGPKGSIPAAIAITIVVEILGLISNAKTSPDDVFTS